ncbi:MAG: hypothetical protein A2Y82_02050 [Candidatus Buchananbacteria bacterium RBG_13_36_9]|uniref:RlpA-like protein double-psi beta-barrel domain-containing protein n=1 Tax=Candidatus Buchananbacteria bacterium RBG_13_36_9 TaxID=1797530 RepID=A0A1G1XMS0_9BACT|nr:MAG: hypothetical protein A2Y82_02050 [Candidatus Buchananbacteria bacterium RBG_13_36_9]
MKTLKYFLILAIFGLNVNYVWAADLPVFSDQSATQPNLQQIQFAPATNLAEVVEPINPTAIADTAVEIILNSQTFNLAEAEVWAGKKFKVFDNKFVFQIDSEMIKSPANLNLKEIILAPNSIMAPPKGMQLGSRIYEFDFKPVKESKLDKAIWLSVKYESNDYFRKNFYYFDQNKNQWLGIKGIISDGAQKIIVNISMPYAKVAILEDIDIMTEGTASWYKYKGCDCAASPDYPKGTKLKVTNLKNDKSVIVKVNDWGPDRSVHPDRVIDLDVVAFKKIATKSAGLCQVKVELAEPVKAATN